LPNRILHIIDTLDRTGTAQQVKLLARGMPREVFETHVCALNGDGPVGEELRQAGIPVETFARRWPADPFTFWHLVKYVKEVKPDVIVGWQPAGRAYAAAAARQAGKPRLVAVWRTAESNLSPWQRAVNRYVGSRADVVVAACPAVRGHCVSHGIAPEKVRVIPSGVVVQPQPVLSREQLLDRLGLPESARLIGWAARLQRDRGGKDAIWAADLLKVIRDDVHLLVFGDGPHRDRLVRFRDQVEIADKVHFLGDRGEFGHILPLVDQFWSTGRRAGQPQAVLEAMAAGVPVVAADVPGMRDLIEHEKTGYLFAPGHRAGIVRWAEHLLNHHDAAQQVGAAGRQRIESTHSVDEMIQRWKEAVRG
jgi:glycosyltransferase involved in cell wall biosynthesis